MKFKRFLAAVALAAATSMAANAADIPMAPTVVAPPPPPPAATFSWAGPYVGVYAGGMFGNAIFVGVDAGYAFQFGNFVASVEGAIGTAIGGPPLHWSLWGRLGPTLGERVWLYGLVGISNYGTAGEYGGGVAFALNNNLTFHTDVTVYCCWSPVMIKAGLNYHFGN